MPAPDDDLGTLGPAWTRWCVSLDQSTALQLAPMRSLSCITPDLNSHALAGGKFAEYRQTRGSDPLPRWGLTGVAGVD